MFTSKTIPAILIVAILCISGVAVADGVISRDAGPETGIDWTNTDVISNIYPEYKDVALKDNFYSYVMSDRYKAIASCEDAAAALNAVNTGLPLYDEEVNNALYTVNVMSGEYTLTGADSGVMDLYISYLEDTDKSDELAFISACVNEIEAMDTAEELADFVQTGGKACLRNAFTSKDVAHSTVTGDTTLELGYGTLPWCSSSGDALSDEVYSEKLEAYKNILGYYFTASPEKAATYYDDLKHISDELRKSGEDNDTPVTYSELLALCSEYPLSSDVHIFNEAGCSSYTPTDPGYISALDSITEDGYRYARAIAMYGLLSSEATHMGTDYASFMIKNPSGSIIKYADAQHPDYSMYVGKYFAQALEWDYRDELVEETNKMIDTAGTYFSSLDWISDETKAEIQDKLDNLVVRACGPVGEQFDQYDYTGGLEATCLTDLDAKMRAANDKIHAVQCVLDRGEYWPANEPPQYYNATYDPSENSINMLAVFTDRMDDDCSYEKKCALVYFIIGHEITHGFDAGGSNYTPDGRYDPGWMFTEEEMKEFNARNSALVDFLNTIPVYDGKPHNGELTIREVTADMGGFAILTEMISDADDFDYDEFFRAFSYCFALVSEDSEYVSGVMTDAHPSGMYRTNLTLMQSEKFYETYGIKEGDGMYMKDRVSPWRS